MFLAIGSGALTEEDGRNRSLAVTGGFSLLYFQHLRIYTIMSDVELASSM